jgi:hypothetical protein
MAETRTELIDRPACTYHMGASPCQCLAVGTFRPRQAALTAMTPNSYRGDDMKAGIVSLRMVSLGMLAVSLAAGGVGPAPAQTVDDVNWINRCIADNKDEGQARPVLVSYCTCTNNQMSSSETKSISAWEKTHKKEADECGKKAGWK